MNIDMNGNTVAAGKLGSAGLSYTLTALPPGGLQINLLAPSGPCSAAATGNDGCCAEVHSTSGTIPWGSFVYHCYGPPPNAAAFNPSDGLAAINFQSNNSTPGPWSYCVTSLQY
jgi:hypothetical protein